MVMKYSISNLGSNDPKKRKPFNTTSQQLAQQVAGQQLTVANKPGQMPGAGGQPQLTSPLDTQTGRQAIKTPKDGPLGQGGAGGLGGAGGRQGPGAGAIGGTLNAATSINFEEKQKEYEKQQKINEAKKRGQKELEEKALINKQEAEQGVDIDGDGKIGYQQELGGGREMTNDEVINTALRNLLREQTDVTAEREAMLGEMRAQEAQAIQGLRARAGLGGMGLTGATAGLEAQARTQAGRAEALTTAQFDRAARDEALRRLIQGIELKRGEEVYGLAKGMFEDELGGGDGEGAGGPGAGTSPANVDADGNPVEPPGGYNSSNPPSNVLIPDNKAKAYEQGYNADPATKRYYENLPFSDAGRFFTDDIVDSYMGDDGKLYGVAINSSGQYYTFKLASESNPNRRNPREGTRAIDRAKRIKEQRQREAAEQNQTEE